MQDSMPTRLSKITSDIHSTTEQRDDSRMNQQAFKARIIFANHTLKCVCAQGVCAPGTKSSGREQKGKGKGSDARR